MVLLAPNQSTVWQRSFATVAITALVTAILLIGAMMSCEPVVVEAPSGEKGQSTASVNSDLDLASQHVIGEALERAGSVEQAAHRAAQEQWHRTREQRLQMLRAKPELKGNDPWNQPYAEWSDARVLGRDLWMTWTAGNQHFWREVARRTRRIDWLKVLDNDLRRGGIEREQRFELYGLINDPDCHAPSTADEYGFRLDQTHFDGTERGEGLEDLAGRASGIVGLRIFHNPSFDAEVWKQKSEAWWQDSSACEPPYLVGVSCALCHATFHPFRPPQVVSEPQHDEIVLGLGNSFFREGPLLARFFDVGDFRRELLLSQPAGTSDTSRFAHDDIDNPSAMNAIQGLGRRLQRAPLVAVDRDATASVARLLKDGADSKGAALGLLRVYVNLGLCGDYWLSLHDGGPIFDAAPSRQKPFELDVAMAWRDPRDGRATCHETLARLPDLTTFLAAERSFSLAEFPEHGHGWVDATRAARGATVFKQHCASCHSDDRERVAMPDPQSWIASNLGGDLLADDEWVPLPQIGGNAARAVASNAIADAGNEHIWARFASQAYRDLPAAGVLRNLQNPFDGPALPDFELPASGRGYYRTAALRSLWTSAPFFHNQGVGEHVHDPSIAARRRAFEMAARELLMLDGPRPPRIKRTQADSYLTLPSGARLPVPVGTPIKWIANLPLHAPEALQRDLLALIAKLHPAAVDEPLDRAIEALVQDPAGRDALRRLVIERSTCPDYVESRGHEAQIAPLPRADREDLLEFLKIV